MIFDKQYEIQKTEDGSATIYLPDIDEHYHSTKGAMTESKHIFRDCGLLYCDKKDVRVLEIGFGTGLNALVTALTPQRNVQFLTLEKYPLSADIIANTNYAKDISEEAENIYKAIHSAPWEELSPITPSFSIQKIQTDFTNPSLPIPQNIDVVYFDAFAPEKQEDMWSEDCLRRIFEAMNSGGIFTTYCAKGVIRRRLQSIGFICQRIPGPVGGKREILRAIKP